MVRPRPHLRVRAADVGPLPVHRAAARLGIEKVAIAAGPARDGEDLALEVEVVDQPGFLQPLGNLLGRLMLDLERINQSQPDEVRQPDLQWHGAAVGHARVAQAGPITRPCLDAVNVDDVDRGSHGIDTQKAKRPL